MNGIDPSGLINVQPWVIRWIAKIGISAAYYLLFGWLAEFTIRSQYAEDSGTEDVLFGRPLGRNNDPDLPPGGNIDLFRKNKPDILDKRRKSYYEIKSGSIWGVADGLRQLRRYDDAVAARWPGQGYSRGLWSPSEPIQWLKAPLWIAGDLPLPVGIDLPVLIVTYLHSPGLVVYDPYTLAAQALAWGSITEEVLARVLMKILFRVGGPPVGPGPRINDALNELFKPQALPGGVRPIPPKLPGPVIPPRVPPIVVASANINVFIGGV